MVGPSFGHSIRLLWLRSFNVRFRLFSFGLFYVAFITGPFALAALDFAGAVIDDLPAACAATVPIAIRMPLIVAFKFGSVPDPTLIFVTPNPIRIIRRRILPSS